MLPPTCSPRRSSRIYRRGNPGPPTPPLRLPPPIPPPSFHRLINAMTEWKFQIVVTREPDGFHSHCEELDLSSFGKTLDEAVADLKDAIEFYLETASRDEIERLKKKMDRKNGRNTHHRRFEI